MGLIGINNRSDVSPAQRRKSFLHLVYENGYHDGWHTGEPLREELYTADAFDAYRRGWRIGKRERARV
jgi:hypothetical protein